MNIKHQVWTHAELIWTKIWLQSCRKTCSRSRHAMAQIPPGYPESCVTWIERGWKRYQMVHPEGFPMIPLLWGIKISCVNWQIIKLLSHIRHHQALWCYMPIASCCPSYSEGIGMCVEKTLPPEWDGRRGVFSALPWIFVSMFWPKTSRESATLVNVHCIALRKSQHQSVASNQTDVFIDFRMSKNTLHDFLEWFTLWASTCMIFLDCILMYFGFLWFGWNFDAVYMFNIV